MALELLSKSFSDGDYLSNKHILSSDFGFGCQGSNISPELHWNGIPDGTKSLGITCYDPDAPTGSGFWHWLLVNIPVCISSIPEGLKNLPDRSIETRTDFGKPDNPYNIAKIPKESKEPKEEALAILIKSEILV